MNDKLEKFKLNVSRYTNRDVAPLRSFNLLLHASLITELKSAATLVATDDDRSTIETCLVLKSKELSS